MPHRWPDHTHILLVEDNPINQLVATTILNNSGLEADIAGNGVEALQHLLNAPNDAPYSLVLMDCQMPEMDGYEATRCIRKGEAGDRNTHIPIVAMTANAMEGDKEKCLNSGMSDYLSKPIDPESLVNMLRRWLLSIPKKESHENDPVSSPKNGLHLPLEIWDKADVLDRIGGLESFLRELVISFLGDKDTQLAQIQQALLDKDFSKVREITHAVKGAAGQLSGKQLAQIAQDLESSARVADEDKIHQLMPIFCEAFDELTAVFNVYIISSEPLDSQFSVSSIPTHEELTICLLDIQSKLQKFEYIDPESLHILDSGHTNEEIQTLLSQLKIQVCQFDNTSAFTTLIAITKSLNIQLDTPNGRV